MFICKNPDHLHYRLQLLRDTGASLGFVPTMGALHAGHLSLIARCREECTASIVSVFVNPRQFNNANDLKNYPRPVVRDIELVTQSQTDVLFIPEVEAMYPPVDSYQLDFDPGPLDAVMEGVFRPGHFQGVADVVYRLLRMVAPDRLYLGQKDFQQVAIIRKLIRDTGLNVQVVVCPTLREPHGLAMSSRNVLLSAAARERAGLIYAQLLLGKEKFDAGIDISNIRESMIAAFRGAGFEPEYAEVINGDTLQAAEGSEHYVVACCAVSVEGVRLIDNMVWKET